MARINLPGSVPNQNYSVANQNPQWEQGFAQSRPMMNVTRDQALGMVGKPANFSHTGSIDSDLDAYYGTNVSGRSDYGATGDVWGSASGGGGGASSIGGVSAVNPQAGQANELDAFKRYEDQAYNDAMSRLDPQLQAAQRDFDQQMVNQGIPVGSEAYNSAKAQFEQNKAGALNDAAFGAMQFGLGAQNQSFQQDHARSALANALLQAQWQKELGLGNIGLGYANLGERGRQFDQGLGQRAYEFDSGQDFDYWDRGNYWDFAGDRADSSDYFNSWDRNYGAQQDFMNMVLGMYGQQPGSQGINPFSGYSGPASGDAALYSFLFGGG